jgi:hypothetical protein
MITQVSTDLACSPGGVLRTHPEHLLLKRAGGVIDGWLNGRRD